jgi:Acetyltransferase (GNAT) family
MLHGDRNGHVKYHVTTPHFRLLPNSSEVQAEVMHEALLSLGGVKKCAYDPHFTLSTFYCTSQTLKSFPKQASSYFKMDEAILYDPKLHAHLIPSIVAVHVACITQPTYTVATFLPPLDHSEMQTWWEDRTKEVVSGSRHIIMQLAANPTTGKEEIAGVVMLDKPQTQTVPHTAWVEKLLVLPECRKKGVTKRMMLKLEEVAKSEGRTLLVS